MNDIFEHSMPRSQRVLAGYHIKRMVLSPDHWTRCSLPVDLQWGIVPFKVEASTKVPKDQIGIYTFVLEPGIANHPACSYLLYVGQTDRQDFRTRYKQYLRDLGAGEESRRPHITEMLEKWEGFLWFCYAPVKDRSFITPIEDALLSAYLPPVNKDFPAKISHSLRKLFAT